MGPMLLVACSGSKYLQ